MKDTAMNSSTTLNRMAFCIGVGSFLLVSTSFLLPNFLPITSVLVGGFILGLIYYFPGHISAIRDLQLLLTWIVTSLVSAFIIKLYCLQSVNQLVCAPSAVRAAIFGIFAFSGIIVIALWLYVRIRYLINRLRR